MIFSSHKPPSDERKALRTGQNLATLKQGLFTVVNGEKVLDLGDSLEGLHKLIVQMVAEAIKQKPHISIP